MLNASIVSIANMQALTDADRLRQFVDKLEEPQSTFAKREGIPGGASMVSQHLSGHRPISLEAAIAYARGFQCRVEDISPTAAALIREGAALLDATAAPQPASRALSPNAEYLAGVLDKLTERQQEQIIAVADMMAGPYGHMVKLSLSIVEPTPNESPSTEPTPPRPAARETPVG